jgi:AhpD family alkylhydroperoxidase
MTTLIDDAPTTSGPRIDYAKVAPGAAHAQIGLETYIRNSGLEHSLIHLMKLRASYINGCAYCVDMHTKDARAEGETEQRLYAVPVWRETPFFTPRERAALAWTDAVNELGRAHVPDEVFEEVRRHFTDVEIVNLTMVVVTINGWNRIAIALRNEVGSYVPRK